jgi:aspartate aminotransferase
MRPYTIFIDGITKAFASTGLRVGWALGPAEIISKMKAILSHLGAWAPMAEQKAVAKYLLQKEAIEKYFVHFKTALEDRLNKIYNGFIALKEKGFSVDAVTPQAAIYLTVRVDLKGKKTAEGKTLLKQTDVTDYILSEAKLAIVPFSAFGGDSENSWYRLSVGTCKIEEIEEMFIKFEAALQKLN